jgi:hypothetical protein
MATGVRITKVNSSGTPIGNIDFERYECMEGSVVPAQKNKVQRAQNRKPTLLLIGDLWYDIFVTIRVHGNSTINKLTSLQNFIYSGRTVRVYPKFYKDPSNYYKCIIDPATIPLESLFSAEYKAGDTITLTFHQHEKGSVVTIEDDIIVST